MNRDMTQIIELVAALIAAMISAWLIPLIKSRTNAAQQQQINDWVAVAVSAAEMIYTGAGRGVEKKDYVFAFLQGKGLTVDEKVLDALIEAAVYKLKSGILA